MAKKTRNAIEILERLTGDDPKLREMIAEKAVKAQVARMIYEARTAAGLFPTRGGQAPAGHARTTRSDVHGSMRASLCPGRRSGGLADEPEGGGPRGLPRTEGRGLPGRLKFRIGETFSPLARPEAEISVADLFFWKRLA